MWQYMRGISEGNALGEKTKRVMAEMGLPPLKGLAPGMIEDAERALNPAPLMSALFGSGYPQCKRVTLEVGDAYGRIADPDTGENWIGEEDGLARNGNEYVQTRWIQDTDRFGNPVNLTKEKWLSEPKTYNPDGTPIKSLETFENMLIHPSTIIVVGLLCLLGLGLIKK
jgi:hypothetical protein